MASGFVYRCWTNENRGFSGNFLIFVSVVLALMVMFMVNKAYAFVATVTAVEAGNHKFLVEEKTIRGGQATVKPAKHHKQKRKLARKAKKRWRSAVARIEGHSLGSQLSTTTAEKVGVASWYGPGFHGRRTASGTRYDMNELTAAHKTLPFGTRLLVKNKATGKSTVVTITDRGPYVGQRVLDLSKEAARQLHMIRSGISEVEYTEI
jgi:rare lipoprotein A (peptidoglycan hydrolase)